MLQPHDFTKAKRDKLPQRLARIIRNYILDSDCQPGEKLPSEVELARIFSVSRQTMREVLRVLEIQGLLEIRPGAGGGTFVRKVGLDVTRQSLINFFSQTNLSLHHISEIRKLLDPYFAGLAAQQGHPELIAELTKIVMEQKRCLDLHNLKAARMAEIQFHITLARATDNPLLILLQDFIETALEKLKDHLKPDYAFSENSFIRHSEILEAIKNHDFELARQAILDDIFSVEKDLSSLGFNQANKIFWINSDSRTPTTVLEDTKYKNCLENLGCQSS